MAKYIVGEHDFKAFCAVGTGVKSTVRNVYSLDIERDNNDIISITITGNGFLYNMVRIIVGTLIQVGTGKISSDYLEEIILQIIKRKYISNPFYTELLNDFMNDVKREKRRGF